MKRIAACDIIINTCLNERVSRHNTQGLLTGSIYKSLIVLFGQKRVREVSEELFEQSGDAVDVVNKAFRISEIHRSCILIS